ncbi:hypothetical protein S518_004320 [Salmonella enterica subsp. enterica]|nr:hypothetical protein [Salmonella enterica subsp. enterica]
MQRRKMPSAECSIFYTRVDALRANDPPLEIESAADNNVMKITENCLFMRSAFGSIYGGRNSMSWREIIVVVFTLVFFSYFEHSDYLRDVKFNGYFGNAWDHYIENWQYTLGVTAFTFIGFSWSFIP